MSRVGSPGLDQSFRPTVRGETLGTNIPSQVHIVEIYEGIYSRSFGNIANNLF